MFRLVAPLPAPRGAISETETARRTRVVVRRWGLAPIGLVAFGLLAWLIHAIWAGGGAGDPFGVALLIGLGAITMLCAASLAISLRYRAALELGDRLVLSERWLFRGRTFEVDQKDLKIAVRPVRWVLSRPPLGGVVVGLFVEHRGVMVCVAVDASEDAAEIGQVCSAWAKRLGKRVAFGERVLAWF